MLLRTNADRTAHYAVSIACALFLTACSAIDPTNFTRSTSAKTINLSKQLTYKWKEASYFSLAPGTYVAEWEGAGGTFYRGPDHCYSFRNADKPKFDYTSEGGLWLPNNKPKSEYKFYYYLGTRKKDPAKDGQSSGAGANPGQFGIAPTPIGFVGTGIAMGVLQGLAANDSGKVILQVRPDVVPDLD